MECKYCGAEIEESLENCPCCGSAVFEEPVLATNDTETVVTHSTVTKRTYWQAVLAIAGCVALVTVLLFVVLKGAGISLYKSNDSADEGSVESSENVIAKIGQIELTNGELQIFYTLQYYEFTQNYGGYLAYLGLDTSKPLDEQICCYDETLTWQQYFVKISVQTWQRYAILSLLAEEAGIVLPESDEEALKAIPSELDTMAMYYGLENADAFLKSYYGENVDIDDYVSYLRLNYLGEYYTEVKALDFAPSDEEITAYYDAHEADFSASGITKDSGLVSNVRHILVQPEGGEKDEFGNTVYTDEALASALAEAEDILNQWKEGEANEDSFAALASEHTDDTGSISNGGLYQNITSTSNYVEPFRDWAVDESREVGDTEIVETVFGYHIMYFVSGEPQWILAGRTQLISEKLNAFIDAGIEKWPMTAEYDKVTICTNEIVK